MEKIKVRLESIVHPDFSEALRELGKKELPIALAWQIATLMDVIRMELRKFSEVRAQLLQVYGKKTKDGQLAVDLATGNYEMEDQEGFDNAYKQLISLEVEVEPLRKEALEGVTLKPIHLLKLLPVLK